MLDQFARQNRWWLDPGAIARDRHLRSLGEAPLAWEPSLPFRFDRDAVYTLRGPRQVGKSTVLKRQVADLLARGWPARRVMYLDVELAGIASAADLVAALRAYLDAERIGHQEAPNRLAVFLDEVTRVPAWAGAIRGLVDNDELDGVTVVATGSHTVDLRRGGERLPGRRGGGAELDLELLPLGFREYALLREPTLRLPPAIEPLDAAGIRATARDRVLVRPRMEALLERYLLTGGFLAAINDEASTGAVRAETFELYREAIVGEFTRAGLRETYLREIVDWVARHLGQEADYRGVAADTDIGSKDTARHYLDHLVETYTALLVYRTTSLAHPAPAFRSPKKLHPSDPLFWHLLLSWAASDPDPWPAAVETMTRTEEVGHLVESVVAAHLRRAFGERVYFWRTADGREIDFVADRPGGSGTGDVAQPSLVEVKYQRGVDDRDVRTVAAQGGGLVVTRQTEGDLADGAVYAVPLCDLLLLLDTPALAMARR